MIGVNEGNGREGDPTWMGGRDKGHNKAKDG